MQNVWICLASDESVQFGTKINTRGKQAVTYAAMAIKTSVNAIKTSVNEICVSDSLP